MNRRQNIRSVSFAIGIYLFLSGHSYRVLSQEIPALEPAPVSQGATDLDEALKERVVAKGLQDLNRVIVMIETALDKGLEEEDETFAFNMLSDSLMERAMTLMQVINMQSLQDSRVQKIRKQVSSDLKRVVAYPEPPADAYLMLGRILALPDGEPYEAQRILSDYLKLEGLDPVKRAEALVLRGRLRRGSARALSDFEEAIELVPDNQGYRLLRAIMLRTQGKTQEALSAVQEILKQDPELANAHILQGEILRKLKKMDEALVSFQSATELLPESPIPYQNRGEILREQGDFDGAVKEFSKVLELQPGVMLTLIQRAEAYLNGGAARLALTDIELILEKQTNLPRQTMVAAHRIRAEALSKLGRLQEAIVEMEELAKVISDNPEPDLYMQLGLYYLANRQPEKAIDAYSGVLDLEEKNFDALRSRGDSYLNLGKHEEAIADFEKALELQGDDFSLLNNFAWVLATSPEDELRDGEKAIELATKACELSKYEKPHVLSTLAAAYAESGNFEKAIEWSQKSVEMDDPEHRDQLKKELESYRSNKPWRERQTLTPEEDTSPEKEPLTETPQAPPHAEGPGIIEKLDYTSEPVTE